MSINMIYPYTRLTIFHTILHIFKESNRFQGKHLATYVK